MLSKRAFWTFGEESAPKRQRLQEEITFLPSKKGDMVRTVHIFLREIKMPAYPFQITVCFHDFSFGRIGYYDLGYKTFESAHVDFKNILGQIQELREQVEYNMVSCFDIEKLCRAKIDPVLHNAVVFDSTYHGPGTGSVK